MNADKRRAVAKDIGMTIILGLVIFPFVGRYFDMQSPVYTVQLWIFWTFLGMLGLLVCRVMMPIIHGCNCEHHQASELELWLSFILWPLSIPFQIVYGLIAAAIRLVLS